MANIAKIMNLLLTLDRASADNSLYVCCTPGPRQYTFCRAISRVLEQVIPGQSTIVPFQSDFKGRADSVFGSIQQEFCYQRNR